MSLGEALKRGEQWRLSMLQRPMVSERAGAKAAKELHDD